MDDLVLLKLTQPNDSRLPPEQRGLGWDEDLAVDTYQALANGIDPNYEELNPAAAAAVAHGLDYEDQRIFGLLLAAMGERAWANPVLVTRDSDFASVANNQAPMLTSGLPKWRAVTPKRLLQSYGAF
ncbi:MAG TPA: hypothetical protein VNF71_09635 [Acidimicrobiales bacterium]|nr:hypothetical protein [Acidimicrobiales bacterium]